MKANTKSKSILNALTNFAFILLICGLTITGCSKKTLKSQTNNSPNKQQLIVYSARAEHLIKPIFDLYSKETGVKIKYSTDKAGALIEKIKAQGESSPADILLTVDAGNLWRAANNGYFQPVDSIILNKNIPASLKDPKNQWFGLSARIRTIIYNSDKINPSDLSTFEDLANSKWKNQLCLRTSKKVYNQSLIAMMIANKGLLPTKKVVEGWVSNLAHNVFTNDTKLIEAVENRVCNIGIVNTYYLARYESKKPTTKVKIFWANQETNGVHINVSGAGILKSSKNPLLARNFIEWLSSTDAQELFANLNHEYPVNPAVKASTLITNWGEYVFDKTSLVKAGENQSKAVILMDQAKYE